jgi:hypothetical protein
LLVPMKRQKRLRSIKLKEGLSFKLSMSSCKINCLNSQELFVYSRKFQD